MSDLDDFLGGLAAKGELIDSLKDSTALFVVWQKPDGSWSHGWVNASWEQLGHVQNAVYTWLRDCVERD
jgi:hypothetical protein